MDKRKEKTRAAIRRAYVAMLTRKGSTRLTVTALAAQANIDRKTFYLHYDTLEDVMADCCAVMIDRLLELLDAQRFFERPFDLHYFYSAVGQLVDENMPFFQHLAARSNMELFWDQAKRRLADAVVQRYKDRVMLREEVLYVYVRFVLAGMQDLYREWLRGELPFSLEELGRMTGDAAFEGFSTVLK
ncbi:MAG: TetR/AcrR family transcriptional regulator [Oscillospiraceae bacterium]|nr:TetR/AcrR family transcriptional regulator [Oscillospiraceae bacterium]